MGVLGALSGQSESPARPSACFEFSSEFCMGFFPSFFFQNLYETNERKRLTRRSVTRVQDRSLLLAEMSEASREPGEDDVRDSVAVESRVRFDHDFCSLCV